MTRAHMTRVPWLAAAVALAALLASCTGPSQQQPVGQPSLPSVRPTTASSTTASPGSTGPTASPSPTSNPGTSAAPSGKVTLGFAGDVHFEDHLAALLEQPAATALAPIAPALRRPDVMMVNLETAITGRGSPEPKEYNFRASPAALEALDAAGVDVASLANNHAVDYGSVGLHDTLAAVRDSPVGVVGIGADAAAAFDPYVVSVRGTRIAVLAATTLPDITALEWAAGRDRPGVAVALLPRPRLVAAVRAASEQADVVVVYLHWGDENVSCPYWRPRLHARVLAAAGADVVVGSHAHVLLGSGWLDDTYINYGLGNFVWYSQASTSTGILTLTVRDGHVVADSFDPAYIEPDGRPRLLEGDARAQATAAWRQLRGCTNLAAQPTR